MSLIYLLKKASITVIVFQQASLKNTTKQLQLIQNAVARILTKTKKVDHITPVQRSLHWLHVGHKIDFKVLLFVYDTLNGVGPKRLLSIPRVQTGSVVVRQRSVSMLHMHGTNCQTTVGVSLPQPNVFAAAFH